MENVNAPELDRTAFAVRLEEELRALAVPLLPGSQLAKLVNRALGEGRSFRDYLLGPELPRLRTFIERFVSPEVVRPTEQRQGSDILFAVPHEASAFSLAQDGRLWKAFVAVQPVSQLVFNRSTGAVSVLPTGLPVPDGCAVVERVQPHEHRALRANFCDSLAKRGVPVGDLLGAALEESEGFYQRWLHMLRVRKPLDREWGHFRNEELLSLYEQRLLQLGAPEDRAQQLKKELYLDHEVARSPKKAADALVAAEAASNTPRDHRDNRERRARELLRVASERLPLEQLLSVQLPVSVILDLTEHLPER